MELKNLNEIRRLGGIGLQRRVPVAGARLGRDVATYRPGSIFGAHSTKISAFPADFAHFDKPLEDKRI